VKTYFTASSQTLQQYKEEYKIILSVLSENNCHNLNSYLERCITSGDTFEEETPQDGHNVYSESLRLIDQSNFLIADVTSPSITIGRQIEYAIQHNLNVLCLKHASAKSHLSSSLYDTEIDLQTFRIYDLNTIHFVLQSYLESYKNATVRFNFLMPKETDDFLNLLSRQQKINKSEVLRQLIEKEIVRLEHTLK
jgi:hypothetical protein